LYSEFAAFVKNPTNCVDWHTLIERIVSSSCQYYILLYEDLLQDPINEMRKLINFLQKEITFKFDNLEERLLCLGENMQGNNKRKKIYKQIDPFTKALKIIINSKIKLAQSVLDKNGIKLNLTSYQRKVN